MNSLVRHFFARRAVPPRKELIEKARFAVRCFSEKTLFPFEHHHVLLQGRLPRSGAAGVRSGRNYTGTRPAIGRRKDRFFVTAGSKGPSSLDSMELQINCWQGGVENGRRARVFMSSASCGSPIASAVPLCLGVVVGACTKSATSTRPSSCRRATRCHRRQARAREALLLLLLLLQRAGDMRHGHHMSHAKSIVGGRLFFSAHQRAPVHVSISNRRG